MRFDSLSSLVKSLPRFFTLFFVLFFVIGWLLFFESFRSYRAEATVMISSKSSAVSAEQVAQNISALLGSSAFYNRLIAEHENIDDPWKGEVDVTRGELWSKIVESEVLPETSMIRIALLSPESSQSNELLNAVIETLYGFSGRFYDRDLEADLRLVGDISVRPELSNPLLLVILSVLLAAVLSFAVTSFLKKPFPFSFRATSPRPIFSKRHTNMLQPVGTFSPLSLFKEKAEVQVSEERSASPTSLSETSANSSSETESSKEIPSSGTAEPAPSFSSPPTPERVSSLPEIKTDSILEKSVVLDATIGRNTSEHEEPHDIWERPLVSSGTPLSQRETPSKVVSAPPALSASLGASLPLGTLETVRADEFSWEKVLFPEESDSSPASGSGAASDKADEAEGQGSSTAAFTEPETQKDEPKKMVPEKREPTPEELKARLNELLRGE